MINKILSFIALFVLGTALAFFLFDELFRLMQEIYVWASDGKIDFIGKYILIPSPFGVITFGLSFAIVAYRIIFHVKKKLLRTVFSLFFFCTFFFVFSYISGLRAIEDCTQCSRDVFYLHFHTIRITEVLFISSVISASAYLREAMKSLRTPK